MNFKLNNSLTLNLKFFIFFNLCVCYSCAQEGTRISQNTAPIPVGKIMIIPFEPKLYMSDIDKKINQQTKWAFEQIRENFRHQLEIQLKIKLQSTARVVSFYSDSIKMSKDLLYIYKSTTLSYDLITPQNQTSTAAFEKNGIKNGQLSVEINTDKKFMNTKINDVQLLSYLNKKYKTNYFVFINQLDIKNDMDSYDISTDTYQRETTVHFSIFDKTGKNILAGISTSRFSSKENDPKKIVSTNFSTMAINIAAKFTEALKPEPVKQPINQPLKGKN